MKLEGSTYLTNPISFKDVLKLWIGEDIYNDINKCLKMECEDRENNIYRIDISDDEYEQLSNIEAKKQYVNFLRQKKRKNQDFKNAYDKIIKIIDLRYDSAPVFKHFDYISDALRCKIIDKYGQLNYVVIHEYFNDIKFEAYCEIIWKAKCYILVKYSYRKKFIDVTEDVRKKDEYVDGLFFDTEEIFSKFPFLKIEASDYIDQNDKQSCEAAESNTALQEKSNPESVKPEDVAGDVLQVKGRANHPGSKKDVERIETTRAAYNVVIQEIEQGKHVNAEGQLSKATFIDVVKSRHLTMTGKVAHYSTIREGWKTVPESRKLKGREKEQ